MTMQHYEISRTQFYDLVDEIHKRINTTLYLVVSEQNRQFCSQNSASILIWSGHAEILPSLQT